MRHALPIALALLTGACATAPDPLPDRVAMDRQQWQTVQSEAPLVGEALLQSLLAFSETDPQSALLAKEQAIELARRAGVVTTPRPSCGACALPKNEEEVPGHMACLVRRLNCLRPR